MKSNPSLESHFEEALITAPKELYDKLEEYVVDQRTALEQISVTLYKHIRRLKIGNILLIGNSGTGKTTIMRSIERVFAKDPALAQFINIIRLNANVVADEESSALESNIVLERLKQNALRIMGKNVSEKRFVSLMENSVVFLDEVDKIRSHVGDRPNTRGILAQEALLTLIEGEGVAMPLRVKTEQGQWEECEVHIQTGRILFICGGAFEDLYDMVYRRVASGEHRDKLVQEFVIEEDQNDLNEKIHFSLQDYVRYEDLFTYGMTPQFLGRFDEVIVLNDLTIQGLIRIFVEPPDALYREARRYFRSLGIELQVTKEALKQVAEAAYENHRLGARALRMVFKRILRGIEFDPQGSYHLEDQDGRKILRITKDMVDRFS